MPDQNSMVDTQGMDDPTTPLFEEELKARIKSDMTNATGFLKEFHAQCVGSYEHYFNASKYVDLKQINQFPLPFFQQMIDDFVSDLSDKLNYRNQPCTIVPVEETDKDDAQAKQDLFKWMDYKDNIEGKLDIFLRDCAKYRICVAQIDYEEKTEKRLMGTMEEGQQVQTSGVDLRDVPIFKGATVKRVDPLNFYIGEDKRTIDDGKPIIIVSYHPMLYFKSKPYFKNLTALEAAYKRREAGKRADSSGEINRKRMFRDLRPEETGAKTKDIEYQEWQAKVNKKRLYEYLEQPVTVDIPILDEEGLPTGEVNTFPTVGPNEEAWCICGMAEEEIIRLEENPFQIDRPNVVIGIMQADEDEIIGTSLADKIGAIQQGMEVMMGILLENFRQSVNAGWVLNRQKITTEGDVIVNKPGFIIETNDDVDKAAKRVEVPRVSPDIYQMLGFMEQLGRDAGGIQRPISAQGDPTTETLGEYQSLLEQSTKKMIKYLRSFERSLIQPLYEMRNQINMQFLDQEYVYGIIGEGAIEWRTMEPQQIRANVDFICESSTREANKLIVTQQILQLGKIAPIAMEMGFPIRFDVLLGQLAEQGFSWSKEKIHEIFPTLKMEEEGEVDLNKILLENMMIKLAFERVAGLTGIAMGGQPGGGGNGPQPRSEGDARQSLDAKNRTQPGRTM